MSALGQRARVGNCPLRVGYGFGRQLRLGPPVSCSASTAGKVASMPRIDLDRAIVELDELLTRPFPALEHSFQEWLERNANVVFRMLGFRRWLPHPRLPTPHAEEFIPDFMAETINGLWEVVELKTAAPSIYKERNRRSDFYEPIHTTIAQCREYSDWIGHDPAKSEFEATYGTRLTRAPSILMIAGAETSYDRQQVADNLAGRTPPMRLITWGDVLKMLCHYRVTTYGDASVSRGCSVVLSVIPRFRDGPSAGTILDIGERLDRDRVRLSITGNRLSLQVIHSDGSESILPVSWSQRFDVAILLVIEISAINGSVAIRVEIDREHAAEVSLAESDFEVGESPVAIVLGADMQGARSAMLTMVFSYVDPKPMPPKDAWAVQRFAWHLGDRPGQYALKFEGAGQFMYTEGHPLLDQGMPRTGNLVQRNNALRPTLTALPDSV